MQNLKKLLDDFEREIQNLNDLNDKVLVIEEENEFGEQFETFEWRVNITLPGIRYHA